MKFYITKTTEGSHTIYYLYTDEEATYYCKLSPSYWLEACGAKAEKQPCDYSHELSHYVHKLEIDNLPKEFFGDFGDIDEALEAFQTNPRYF